MDVRTCSRRGAAVFLLALIPVAGSAQQSRPHILVTNDDGIDSEGIAAIVT